MGFANNQLFTIEASSNIVIKDTIDMMLIILTDEFQKMFCAAHCITVHKSQGERRIIASIFYMILNSFVRVLST